MNKKRPDDIRLNFESEVNSLIDFYQKSENGLKGQEHEGKNLTILSELVFLNTYVSFETFISDLFIAYINKKSINYQNKQEAKIKKLVKEHFGDWYSNKISMNKVPHLKAEDVERLIDPQGFNLTFNSTEEMKKIAGGWISQELRESLFRLSADDCEFIDCCREIRNAIAHKSKRSFTSMNVMLRRVDATSTIAFIHRPANDIKNVGVFLKSKIHGEQRIITSMLRLKDIALAM
ncbi:MAG: hypothetical protein RR721_14810 [Aeromonas sp.]|uniref:hypothetical protein n=1 Tax=Aeromonas sp. TaxID=647 RepID=UPI002FC9173C